MTTTITDAFILPKPEDIRAMGFVVRLRDADPSSAEVEQLARDYVVTPAVARELPRLLDEMKQVYDRGEEYGRFIHGSFGSGKSHFMTMLALLIEGAPAAWNKFRPVLDEHRARKPDAALHEAWLAEAGLLVVRIHMLSVGGKSTGLDRAVYDAFNAALKRRKKAPFEFVNLEAVFDEVRREATEYGDVVWKRLETAGIVGGREDFEAVAAGTPLARERLARAWLEYKGRDPAGAGIDPRWSDGLQRMAEHAKAQGFGGIVLMVDEFLLWLAEKSGQEFVREINNLNVIVDHNTGQRAAPVFVFVARQRNLKDFFPDLVDESKIHEHLEHHAERFQQTKLEDVELRHIVKGRVLRPRDPAAIEKVVSRLAEKHANVLPALIADGDIGYLRDVYPFHPALIAALIDITSLMQRERSALRLLYELLVVHYPELPLGEFLPVGSAFAAIFPPAGVEASKKVDLMQDIHHQYYSRLAPAMQRLSTAHGGELSEERLRALDQIVKTVLLAEVSPRLKQAGLTVERLVQLNSVDVEGETFRGRVRVTETDLLALSQHVPDLQIAGTGKSSVVRYVLGRVSLGEILARARSKVDNTSQRFKVFWAALKNALELADTRGFQEGGPNEGEYELLWRRTRRRGSVKLGNVREMSYEDFAPPEGAFKVLVDYPWDEPPHSVDEDRLKATNVRKNRGLLHTTCWLPRHMTTTELNVITELAAVRYLLSEPGQAELLDTFGSQDRAKVLEEAATRARRLEAQLDDLLIEVYVRHGELFSLISDVDTSRPRETLAENLEHAATLLMDRRYPQHPTFVAEPRRQDLEQLLDWMIQAGDTSASVAYDDGVAKVLKNLAQPLELVNLGQTKASLRLDSRYIKDVLTRADQDSVAWAPIAEHLRDTYGLQPMVVDLFLAFLCQRDHRALAEPDGEPVEVKLGMPAGVRLRLQRGKVVAAADWHRLRDLGNQLFGVTRPPAHRSLQGQDRFARSLMDEAQKKRLVLQALHQSLAAAAATKTARLEELAEANARLAPLAQRTTDSHKAFTELLAQWPDDASDPLRAVVQQVESARDAYAELSQGTLSLLQAGVTSPEVGARVREHLGALDTLLGGAQAQQPLTKDRIRAWNAKAQELATDLVGARPTASPPQPLPAPAGPSKVLLDQRIDPSDAEAVSGFLGKVREALARQGGRPVRLVLRKEEEVG